MSASTYWIKRSGLDRPFNSLAAHDYATVGPSTAPIFMLSDLEEDALKTFVDETPMNAWDIRNMTHPSSNYAPNSKRLVPESLNISDNGMLELRWNAGNDETMYPYFHATGDKKPRAFALWIGTTAMATRTNGWLYNADFDAPFDLWITGTVGDYQSGADLEFEDVSGWKLGRTLYIEDNKIELPIRLLR